jgi:hypothetical protein
VLAGGQGVAPLAIDLNSTHATHPLWPGHARFHVVWQSFASFFLAIPEIVLLWWPGSGMRSRVILSAILIATSLCGFVVAAVSRRLYGGTFHDPGGIPPLRVGVAGHELHVDGNALAVAAGVLVLAAALLLFFFSS